MSSMYVWVFFFSIYLALKITLAIINLQLFRTVSDMISVVTRDYA